MATESYSQHLQPGGLTVLLVGATLAFVGMGLFMFSMGRDMHAMTETVSQMSLDVSSVAHTTGVIGVDLNRMTRPESIMLPFMP